MVWAPREEAVAARFPRKRLRPRPRLHSIGDGHGTHQQGRMGPAVLGHRLMVAALERWSRILQMRFSWPKGAWRLGLRWSGREQGGGGVGEGAAGAREATVGGVWRPTGSDLTLADARGAL